MNMMNQNGLTTYEKSIVCQVYYYHNKDGWKETPRTRDITARELARMGRAK